MGLRVRPIEDLISIALAGGGMSINVGTRSTVDIARLAEAANKGGAQLILHGIQHRFEPDLVLIARAGGGRVVFVDE